MTFLRGNRRTGTVACSLRSARPGYMLTTPALVADGRRRQSAGRCGTGGAGAGEAAALAVNQTQTQLHATHRGGAGGGPGPSWDRRGGTGGGPGPTDIEEPAGGVLVMSRLRCGRTSDSDGRDWDGRDLRSAGLVQHARPHHSTAGDRARRVMQDRAGGAEDGIILGAESPLHWGDQIRRNRRGEITPPR